MSVNYHSLGIPLHRLAPVRTSLNDSLHWPGVRLALSSLGPLCRALTASWPHSLSLVLLLQFRMSPALNNLSSCSLQPIRAAPRLHAAPVVLHTARQRGRGRGTISTGHLFQRDTVLKQEWQASLRKRVFKEYGHSRRLAARAQSKNRS